MRIFVSQLCLSDVQLYKVASLAFFRSRTCVRACVVMNL